MTQFTKAAALRTTTVEPTEDEIAFCLAFLEKRYSLPETPVDWFSYDNFLLALKDVDMSSTPGYPYMREAPTNGDWLRADGLGGFDPQQLNRLWYDVNLVQQGLYPHQFRVFIKDEPHKTAKILQSRWRLIMCASLPVQMLWRMALWRQNKWLNDHPYDVPSAHGLVFCYGGWRRFKAHCNTLGIKYSRDISSWDVNAPGWVFRVIKEFRQRAQGSALWRNTLDTLYEDAFEHPTLRFSNGLVVRQEYSGTMKSGLFITIADNSLAMVAMHFLACLRSGQMVGSLMATGDDVIQTHVSDSYLDELERLGCKVKEVEQRLVFMGTDFSGEPTPEYFEKHVVNFWTTEEFTDQRLDAYARLWCHDPEIFNFWKVLATRAGVTLRSRAYYLFWYDNPFARFLDFL